MKTSSTALSRHLSTSLLLGATLIPLAANAETLQFVGEWPGHPRESPSAIEIVGARAYLATSSGLSVLDATDPAAINFLGYTDLTFVGAWDVAVSGNRAVLCFGSQPIRVVDVTDPTTPVETHTLGLSQITWAIQVVDRYAYAGQLSNGLRVLDLDAEGAPRVVNTINTAARGRLQFQGDRAYLPTTSGLEVYLFANPIAGSLSGAYAAGSSAGQVALAGDRAYLAAGDGLHVLDITVTASPNDPQFLALYPTTDEVLSVQLEGDRAYLACGDKSVKVLDINTPSQPVLLGEYAMTGIPRGLAVRDAHAFILNYDSVQAQSSLEVVDFTDPAVPVVADEWESAGSATEVKLDGTFAYVADGTAGLSILDVENPLIPTLHGTFFQSGESVQSVDQSGARACVGDNMGMRVLNVSDPANPQELGYYFSFNGWVSHVKMAGDRVYLTSGFGMGELEIVSILNPAAPSRMGGYMVFADLLDLEQEGDFAFLAEGSTGLEVVDCTNPAMPVQADLYDAGASVNGVYLVREDLKSHAFLAVGDGLDIVDVTDPTSVTFVSHWGEQGINAQHVFVDGGRAFLQGGSTHWILDISVIDNPRLLGEVPGGFGNVVASGHLVYSPARAWGLQVYQVIPDSTGPILNYTVIPNNQLRLIWSDAGTGWTLQFLDDLGSLSNWEGVAGSPEVTQWDLPMTGSQQFFRLTK